MSDPFEKNKPSKELISFLAASSEELFLQASGDAEKAKELAWDFVVGITKAFGGEVFYMPKDCYIGKKRREWDIYCEFKGNNVRDLARKHGCTIQHVYDVIRRVRKEESDKRQLRMDFDG